MAQPGDSGGAPASASEIEALRARVAELEALDAERRKALAALRAIEDRYELALSAGKVGVWEWNVQTQSIYISPNLKSMLGYSAEDIPDTMTDWMRLIAKEDRGLVAEATQRILSGAADASEVEHRKRTKDGGARWILGKGTAIRAADGGLLKIVGTDTDITERKRSEESDRRAESAEGVRAALEREIAFRKRIEARLLEAQKLARLGSWEWDMQSDEVFLSDELLSIFGRHRGEFVPTLDGVVSMVHPDDRPIVFRLIAKARSTGGEFEEHLRILRLDGSAPTLHVHGRVGVDESGNVVRLLGAAQDVTEIVAAERAIRESEERFRTLADSAPMMIWMSGLDARCTFFNKRWLEFTGKTLEEQVGEGWKSVIHPEDLAACERRYLDAFALRASYEMEYRVRRSDGEFRWVLDIGVPRRSPDREFLGFVGSCVDIDSRRRAEAALRESEQRYRLVVAALEEGIILQDAGGAIRACNPGAEAIFGVPVEEMIGRTLSHPCFQTVAPDGTPQSAEMLPPALALAAGVPFSRITIGVRRPDGELRWASVNSHPLFNPGEARPHAVVSSLTDVTERRRHEADIQREKEFSQSLIDSSMDGIHAFDRECRFTVWNPAMEKLAGKTKEEALGKNAFETFPLLAKTGEARYFKAALEGKASRVSDGPVRTGKGEPEKYYERYYSPLRGVSGRIEGGIAIIRDVTERARAEAERRRLESQIQQAQKLESLGILAGGIAHDFNNLLVGILGNAGLALMDLAPESPARRSVASIEKAAARAADLTRQMLAYSGKGRFIIEPVNVAALVEEMAHLLEVSISKTAHLKYEFEPGLPAIEGDATQIRQVVMNLITNASDAIGDKGGVISISAGAVQADAEYLAGAQLGDPIAPGRYVYLEVSDTGCGMDAATKAKIFDPFFTTKFTGRGLGMAAALGIVRGHKGAIRVYSEPGKGTTIKILFPASDLTPRPAARVAEAPDWRGRGLVLIVDDEDFVRDVAQSMAERAGFQVVTAGDGEEGLEVFRARPGDFAAVLLDMTMPRMNGEQAFREIRRIRPETPVILLSGYNEQDATNRFAGKGLAGFIQKPFRYDDLAAKLRAAVGG